jgi:Glycosyltransferase family 87
MVRWTSAAVLLVLLLIGLERALPTGELKDYGSFVASGRAAVHGDDAYGIHALTFHVVLPGVDLWNPNLNPPVSLPAFALLNLIEPGRGFRIWWSISLCCYAVVVLLLVRTSSGLRWQTALWAFALAGLWDTLSLGQIYLPLVLAAVAAWLLMEQGRSSLAGVLVGIVVAMKPNFAVWPLLLLLAGHRPIALWALGSAGVLSLVPMVWLGTDPYWDWLKLIVSDRERAAFLTNASLPGLAARAGVPLVGILFGGIGLVAIGYLAATRRPDATRASALGILGGIAASPLAWVHYTLFLLPVFFRAKPSWLLTASAVLLAVPVPIVLAFVDAPGWQQLTVGSIYTWAVVLCATHVLRSTLREAVPLRIRRTYDLSSASFSISGSSRRSVRTNS